MEDEDGNNPKDAKGDGKRIKLEKEEEDDGREDMEFKLDEEVDQGQSEKDGTDSDDEEDMDEEEARMYDQEQREAFLHRFLRCVFYERPTANTNEELVENLKKNKTFKNPKVEKALLAIPREFFVTEDLKKEAYGDHPLRFSKMGFNISAPHMYALCLEHLNIEPGNAVLDIGSGTGHLTAIAAYLAGPTGYSHGYDIHQHIIDFSKGNISYFQKKSGVKLDNVKFFCRNCFLPEDPAHMYDRIHVGACVPESHLAFLFRKLNKGGILVTPYGDKLMKATKNMKGDVHEETLINVRYSDLVLPSDAEIKEAEKEILRARAHNVVAEESTLLGELAQLINRQKFSDIVFIVEGRKIYAHKFLLQLRSEHFCAMFQSGMKESQADEISLPDVKHEVFLQILRFMYTDEINITSDNCVNLLEQANFYKLDRLKSLCEVELHRNIAVENAAHLLHIADRLEAEQLKRFCVEFIVTNMNDVLKSKAFSELPPDLVKYLLLQLSEGR